jgi:hypothetical protein
MKTPHQRYHELRYLIQDLKWKKNFPRYYQEEHKTFDKLLQEAYEERAAVIREIYAGYPVAFVCTPLDVLESSAKAHTVPYPCLVSGEFIICFKPHSSDIRLFHRRTGIELYVDPCARRENLSTVMNTKEINNKTAKTFEQSADIVDAFWLLD